MKEPLTDTQINQIKLRVMKDLNKLVINKPDDYFKFNEVNFISMYNGIYNIEREFKYHCYIINTFSSNGFYVSDEDKKLFLEDNHDKWDYLTVYNKKKYYNKYIVTETNIYYNYETNKFDDDCCISVEITDK
jgi:hypothetical protein